METVAYVAILSALAIIAALIALAVYRKWERRALERSTCQPSMTRMAEPNIEFVESLRAEAIELSNREAAKALGLTIKQRRELRAVK